MLPVVENPLFFLDYDGTLAPIVDDPAAAVPHPEAPALLRQLDARYPLWVVTGRDLQALASFLDRPYKAIGLHGVQEGVVGRETTTLIPEDAAAALRRFRQSVPAMEGLEVEAKEQSFAVHYRAAADAAAARARLREWLADLPDALDTLWGKKVVELRPQGLTKGTAVRRIADRHPECVPVYLGDDVTDEDAFEALQAMGRETVTIKVGAGDTRAGAHLSGPGAVMEYLHQYV